jgi:hypothetical protein
MNAKTPVAVPKNQGKTPGEGEPPGKKPKSSSSEAGGKSNEGLSEAKAKRKSKAEAGSVENQAAQSSNESDNSYHKSASSSSGATKSTSSACLSEDGLDKLSQKVGYNPNSLAVEGEGYFSLLQEAGQLSNSLYDPFFKGTYATGQSSSSSAASKGSEHRGAPHSPTSSEEDKPSGAEVKHPKANRAASRKLDTCSDEHQAHNGKDSACAARAEIDPWMGKLYDLLLEQYNPSYLSQSPTGHATPLKQSTPTRDGRESIYDMSGALFPKKKAPVFAAIRSPGAPKFQAASRKTHADPYRDRAYMRFANKEEEDDIITLKPPQEPRPPRPRDLPRPVLLNTQFIEAERNRVFREHNHAVMVLCRANRKVDGQKVLSNNERKRLRRLVNDKLKELDMFERTLYAWRQENAERIFQATGERPFMEFPRRTLFGREQDVNFGAAPVWQDARSPNHAPEGSPHSNARLPIVIAEAFDLCAMSEVSQLRAYLDKFAANCKVGKLTMEDAWLRLVAASSHATRVLLQSVPEEERVCVTNFKQLFNLLVVKRWPTDLDRVRLREVKMFRRQPNETLQAFNIRFLDMLETAGLGRCDSFARALYMQNLSHHIQAQVDFVFAERRRNYHEIPVDHLMMAALDADTDV